MLLAKLVGALLLGVLVLHVPAQAVSQQYEEGYDNNYYAYGGYEPAYGPQYDPQEHCQGTPERPVRLLDLPGGDIFCLRLPRFLKDPPVDATGTKKFVRTWNDTCGLYGIVFSTVIPAGGGPPPHVHFAEDEYFLPGTPGDVVRIHAEAAKDSYYGHEHFKQYRAGQVPGFNMPAITVGGVEVPYGSIGYAPIATPHTYKAATDLTNFMAIWGYGFAMEAGVNIPETEFDAQLVLEQTGLWGVPTDIDAVMFNGPDFVNNKGPIAIPPVTWKDLKRLQHKFDAGEKCCAGC